MTLPFYLNMLQIFTIILKLSPLPGLLIFNLDDTVKLFSDSSFQWEATYSSVHTLPLDET